LILDESWANENKTRVVTTRAYGTDHQDEIGSLWKRVLYTELVEETDKDISSLLVFPQLGFEELAIRRLL
jgi:hypothetical protein